MTRFWRIARFRFYCFSTKNAEIWNGFLLLCLFVIWLFQFFLMLHFKAVDYPPLNLASESLPDYIKQYMEAEKSMNLSWFAYFCTESLATFVMGLYIYFSSRRTRFAGSATFLLFFLIVNMMGNFGDRAEKSLAYSAVWWTLLIVGGGLTALHIRSAIRYAKK